MAVDYKSLKVLIKQKPNGHAKYPDFNQLPSVQAAGVDWSQYIDTHGIGWQYDKVSGHDQDDVDSPKGTQWGVIVVEPVFAAEAVAAFPDECSLIDEATFTTFYEDRVTFHLPDYDIDHERVTALKTEMDLLLMLDQSAVFPNSPTIMVKDRYDALAATLLVELDPNADIGAVKKNKRKKWADWKAKLGVNLLP